MTNNTAPARKATRQRAAVAALLADRADFISAQDLHAALRSAGEPVGLATVYRTLQAMYADGELDMMRRPDGETIYRRCGTTSHHHHLVCRECGRTVEIDGPNVEAWADRVADRHGYADVTHVLELFGTCADCAST